MTYNTCEPNCGANAAARTTVFANEAGPMRPAEIDIRSSHSTRLGDQAAPLPRPTVGSVADLTNELHSHLSMLEGQLEDVHRRLGAEHGPMATGNPISSENGPIDFTADQLMDAIRRIDNFRTIVETINARI